MDNQVRESAVKVTPPSPYEQPVVQMQQRAFLARLTRSIAVLGALAADNLKAEPPVKEMGKLLPVIERLGDSVFAVREEAIQSLKSMSNVMLHENNPPLDSEIESLLQIQAVSAMKGKPNLERSTRQRNVQRYIQTVSNELPSSMPPGEYEARKCISLLERQTGFSIRIDPALEEKFSARLIKVQSGRNDCLLILEEMCRSAGCRVEFDGDPRAIKIIPSKQNEPTMFRSGKFLGLLRANPTSAGRSSVELRYTPSSGAMIAHNGDAESGRKDVSHVSFGSTVIPEWKFNSPGTPPPRARKTVATDHMKLDTLRLKCATARNPKKVRLVCDEQGREMGHQNMNVVSNPSDPRNLTVSTCVMGELPWPMTPCPFDSITYGLVDANRYEVFDARGLPIPYKISGCTVDMRQIKISLQCEGGIPAAVDVTVFMDLNMDDEITVKLPNDDCRLGEE